MNLSQKDIKIIENLIRISKEEILESISGMLEHKADKQDLLELKDMFAEIKVRLDTEYELRYYAIKKNSKRISYIEQILGL